MNIWIITFLSLLISSCSHPPVQERSVANAPENCIGLVSNIVNHKASSTTSLKMREFIISSLNSPDGPGGINMPDSVKKSTLNFANSVSELSKKKINFGSFAVIKDYVYQQQEESLAPSIMLRRGSNIQKRNEDGDNAFWVSIILPARYFNPDNIVPHLSKFMDGIIEQSPGFHIEAIQKEMVHGQGPYHRIITINSTIGFDSFSDKAEHSEKVLIDVAISPKDKIEDVLLLIESIDKKLRFDTLNIW